MVGIDEDSVERAEARALERLGAEAELVSWSLAAPPMRAELADENVAVGAFRAVLARVRADKVKVVAIGTGSRRTSSRQASARQTHPSLVLVDSRSTSRGASRSSNGSVSTDRWAPSTVDTRSRAGGRGASVAGRSRTAALTVTALSLSLASIGGFSAAAYVGVLPAPVQQVMHDAVGAPAPGARKAGSSSPRHQPVTSPTAGVGPAATNSAAAGLCRTWSTDKAKGTARDHSVAFRSLASVAGGPDKVSAYCATALATKPAKPTDKGTGKPHRQGHRQAHRPGHWQAHRQGHRQAHRQGHRQADWPGHRQADRQDQHEGLVRHPHAAGEPRQPREAHRVAEGPADVAGHGAQPRVPDVQGPQLGLRRGEREQPGQPERRLESRHLDAGALLAPPCCASRPELPMPAVRSLSQKH